MTSTGAIISTDPVAVLVRRLVGCAPLVPVLLLMVVRLLLAREAVICVALRQLLLQLLLKVLLDLALGHQW